ncbi:MAG: phosphoribosylaminoimidazolesuccinocarboxamide synthase [Actinomycetota bacterium]
MSEAQLIGRGKVRDIYSTDDALVLVATDRVSVFDVVLPTPVPDKGRVLTGLSLFWLDKTEDIVANQVISADADDLPAPLKGDPDMRGRAMKVVKAEPVMVECVARGYITGSGWKDYQRTQAVCGIELPAGLAESEKLPEPIFTPTTKAAEGHDMPLTFAETVELVGEGLAQRLKELTLLLYGFGADFAAERGIILADTKFEFGFADGELILIDEVLTPDSSRFWPADGFEPGHGQPSFDKQYVRDWADSTGWDHEPPGPEIPPEVVEASAVRYRDAYERITGEPFSAYLERMGVTG